METHKYESEKEMTDVRDKHKHEMHEMMLENQALQSRADDKRDRELIRQLRRDYDDAKRRCTELLGENSELRKERDFLKLDKNEQMI
jgi:regulator of replication initiation timing